MSTYRKRIYTDREKVIRAQKRVDPFYRSRAWLAVRAQALARACQRCAICGAPGTHVDHVRPRSERPELSLALENLQVLCARCHGRKTNFQDGGFGHVPRPAHMPDSGGVDDRGLPVNADHPWCED